MNVIHQEEVAENPVLRERFHSGQSILAAEREKLPPPDGLAGKRTALYLLQAFAALLVLVLGAVEGWYKRTDYAVDAISYLDIAKALPRHDWRLVFNALWSCGYPFLIAVVRPLFAPDPRGEWLAIHCLNVVILLFTYLAFLYMVKSFFADLPGSSAEETRSRETFLTTAGIFIFVSTDLCINGASRVGPDPLVDGLFFAAMATAMRFLRSPRVTLSILLGLILGAGYWVKVIFLPVSAIILLVVLIAAWRKRQNLFLPVLSGMIFALCVLPYAIGLSRAVGYFNLGESGSLNYAFHVNLLPRFTNWQGGPSSSGKPVHPTHMLLKDPPFFEFAEPFHNTYPPYGHIVYWYQGYRHFFSPEYQVLGLARSLSFLAAILYRQPLTYAMLAILTGLVFLLPRQPGWLGQALSEWPFFLPPLLAIGLYLWVHIEDRYVASFLGCLALLPFVYLSRAKRLPSRRVRASILGILGLAAIVSLWAANGTAYERVFHPYSYTQDREWKLAAYLKQDGLRPGDKVGVIGDLDLQCTWAYVDDLRIVAQVGGLPYDPHPVAGIDHWYGNHRAAPDRGGELFWNTSPETQAKIMELFRQAGVRAVVANAPVAASESHLPGWEHLAGSPRWVWVHRL